MRKENWDDLDEKYANLGKKQAETKRETSRVAKKKTKIGGILTSGTGGLQPGRHSCECQATKHKLLGNCLRCGRVVCEQEGLGACFFCSTPFPDDKFKPVDSFETIGSLIAGLDEPKNGTAVDKDLAAIKAVAHKEKLLDEQRTKVIDDELDYFAVESNVWLSAEQRKELMKKAEEVFAKKHAKRSERKVCVSLDFAGRQIIQEDSREPNDMNQLLCDTNEALLGVTGSQFLKSSGDRMLCAGAVKHAPRYLAVGSDFPEDEKMDKKRWLLEADVSRVQDRELMTMSDMGWCLSMHQPWATLLVAGVKLHEGRSWYSSHRGRMWIASTAKPVSREDVVELERFYRNHYGDAHWMRRLPDSDRELYVSGCLLGCVDVVDVLSQEEYREKFPDGESSSPFVFVCGNPKRMRIQIPIRGKHRLCA
ncbi:unnamed protein product [Notodromas monacha]|uniref:Activating signal cointegrator 1 n=1 Tax=Notodromas monacha TaxID=399045 RepID=A0A7R9GF82_9CRUS|nr:unnamed protein product [Notodromas monacha]CAG0920428.1 unnamed protein product [Notodromas monacha]